MNNEALATKLQPATAYREQFELLAGENLFGDGPLFLQRLRRDAIERFADLSFPTTAWEDWKHTNVKALADTDFQFPAPEPAVTATITPLLLDGCPRLVFQAGRLAPDLSNRADLPAGVTVANRGDAVDELPELLEEHFGHLAPWKEHPFVALNTACWIDLAVIHVDPDVIMERPIQVIHLTGKAERPTLTMPRILLVAGAGSRVTVLEHLIGAGPSPYWLNAVTEISAGPAARVEYALKQQGQTDGFHTATVAVRQERDSQVRLHALTTGGRLTRIDTSTRLDGPGAEATMGGLYLARGREHVDHHTRIDHVAPNCTSRENYKGILDDQGHGVFNGLVVVHPDAQQTDAAQSNRNLMLSDSAVINTNPQLEIYADDVRCGHGSTVGQLEEEALFYLRTRGLAVPDAQRLLIDGFAGEVLDLIDDPALRKYLQHTVSAWMAAGEPAHA
ncbi:MAG: Fe-S cluster assembly protein SufD [Candidatus Neomarinimicrobiota bacterium]